MRTQEEVTLELDRLREELDTAILLLRDTQSRDLARLILDATRDIRANIAALEWVLGERGSVTNLDSTEELTAGVRNAHVHM